MTVEPWQLLSEDVVFAGSRKRIARRRFRRSDGSEGDYEVELHGPVACVLAVTGDGDLVLIRQFRAGPNRVLHDLPVGFVDDGESPLDAAVRELAEETGYRADPSSVRKVAELHPQGYSTEVRHVFVARDVVAGDADLQEGEDIEVVLVDAQRLRALIAAGELTVTDAACVALASLS